MDSELVTSQNWGEKQNNHDGDGGSLGELGPHTIQPRKGRLRVGVRALENKRTERRFLRPGVQGEKSLERETEKARDLSAILLSYLANALLEATL